MRSMLASQVRMQTATASDQSRCGFKAAKTRAKRENAKPDQTKENGMHPSCGCLTEIPNYGQPVEFGFYSKGKIMKHFLSAAAVAVAVVFGAQCFAEETDLHRAAAQGDLRWAQQALDSGIYVDATNRDGSTPLHIAASGGHAHVVRALIAAGASTDAESETGYTPLHEAADEGHADVAGLLIAAGARVDAKAADGMTPLHRAARQGHADIARVLLEAGANVNAEANDGETPLYLAAWGGHADIVVLLEAAGATD